MAGDWIKMRINIAEDPAVIGIACELDLDEDAVVGKLHRLWGWADQQTVDGNAHSVTKSWIDRYLRVTGFADAMENHGWLISTEKGVTLPNFERHNGQTGKRRALTAKRVAKSKAKSNADGNASGNGASVTRALPREEKRREEKNNTSTSAEDSGSDDPRDLDEIKTICRWWNGIRDEGLVLAGVDENNPSKEIRTAWNRVQRDRRFREALADLDKLREAIRGSPFVHRKGWFTLVKLMGAKNSSGEVIILKLLECGYVDEQPKSKIATDKQRNLSEWDEFEREVGG